MSHGEGLVLAPDGKSVAFVDEAGNLHLWEISGGKKHRLAGHCAGYPPLSCSPNGGFLVSMHTEAKQEYLIVWAVATGKQVLKAKRLEQDSFSSDPAVFSSDGQLLAWKSNKRVRLFDLSKRQELGSLEAERERFFDVVFSADGSQVATYSRVTTQGKGLSGGRLRLWDVRSGRMLSGVAVTGCRNLQAAQTGGLLAWVWFTDRRKDKTDSAEEWSDECRVVDLVTGRTLHTQKRRGRKMEKSAWAVTSDGRTLVVAITEMVFRDILTGGEIARLPRGHRSNITTVSFSPDGRLLATGSADTTVLLWDWKRLCRLSGQRKGQLDAHRLGVLWQTLTSENAADAYRAMGTLIAHPRQAEALLGRLLPAVGAEEGRLFRRLLADLDSDQFAVRESAQKRLSELSCEWTPFLRAVLDGKPSLEVRRRLKRILARGNDRGPAASMWQRFRAVQVLEEIGSPEARRVLQTLAKSEPATPLTQHALAALQRLSLAPAAAPKYR